MPKEKIITGIDIGSSKIATIIASQNSEGNLSVIGLSTIPSRGIKKGVVVDIDEAVESIADCLEGAERMAGYAVSSAFVTIGGSHINSINSSGVVAVRDPSGEISEQDLDRVIDAAKAITLPSSRQILHIIPRGYTVDSQDGVRHPVGMSGIRLEVETNIISGSATVMHNIVKCIQHVAVDTEGMIYSGLVSAESVLNETEKDLGCVLIDIGGGTTKLIIYIDGSPAYSSVIPVGGQHITKDLAIALRTDISNAEKIKIHLGHYKDLTEFRSTPQQENILVTHEASKENGKDELSIKELNISIDSISKKLVEEVLSSRMSEIFNLVSLEVKKSGYAGILPAGVVITGGTALTLGCEELAKRTFKLPVRIGYPTGVGGLIEEISSPAYASTLGLILYGSKSVENSSSDYNVKGKFFDMTSKFSSFIKGIRS